MRRLAATLVVLTACGIDNPDRALPGPDREYFDRAVQPALARRCAFSDCHGTSNRFLRIYAVNRHRPSGGACTVGEDCLRGWSCVRQVCTFPISEPLTALELNLNYDRARGFVDTASPADSLLLTKPLAEAEGGLYHRAADQYGTGLDVFLGQDDPDYQVLARWAAGGAPCDGPDACEVTDEQYAAVRAGVEP